MTSAGPPLLWMGGGLLGAVIGSFLATLILRWPAGRSVTRGRSACDGCGAPIGTAGLVPILSFMVVQGRARCCGARIDRLHPAVEIGAALIGIAAFMLAPPAEAAAGAVLGWFLLALCLLDLRHFWLPDRLTLPLLALGLAAGAAGLDPSLLDRLIGAVAGYGALELVRIGYARLRGREGLGRGDAKLLAAIGAWLGWRALPLVLLGASLIGLAAVAMLMAAGRGPRAADRLPLGACFCLAGWVLWVAAHLA